MILADVNIHFTSIRDFVPTPELDLFKAFHIDLVHGWVVDPAIRDCESWVLRGGGRWEGGGMSVLAQTEDCGTFFFLDER